MGKGVPSQRYSGQGMKPATTFHPFPRLNISGAIPLLPPPHMPSTRDKEDFPLHFTGVTVLSQFCEKQTYGILFSIISYLIQERHVEDNLKKGKEDIHF